MTVLKWLRVVWQWLNSHHIISGFFVTMLGVWAAFWLAGVGEQNALNSATEQRLHMAVVECQYNRPIAQEIIGQYANSTTVRIQTDRPHTSMAAAALEDANIFTVLPRHKVSMFRRYVNDVANLNEGLDAYRSTLEITGYRRTSVEGGIRKNVRSNAAAVLAMAIVLEEELDSYFDETDYDREDKQRIEKRLKCLSENALKDKTSPPTEE